MNDPGIKFLHRQRERKISMLQETAIQTILIQDYKGTSTIFTQKCMDKKLWRTLGVAALS